MEEQEITQAPTQCPVCGHDLFVTRLECGSCGTEVTGMFSLGRLASLREPHASLIEMFLRVRGNVKDMERELGLSYPTVRARLEEALTAAGFEKAGEPAGEPMMDVDLGQMIRDRVERELSQVNLDEHIRARVERSLHGIDRMHRGRERHRRARSNEAIAQERRAILDRLESGEISADEAAELLRDVNERSS
jgi:hypothetical protein